MKRILAVACRRHWPAGFHLQAKRSSSSGDAPLWFGQKRTGTCFLVKSAHTGKREGGILILSHNC